jgi:hypothetical protein
MTVVPHPHHFSLFPRPKVRLKGPHFDTTEMIQAESQAVLNILTEHDLQNAFKNDRSTGDGAYSRKGATSRVMVASRPKVIFWPDDPISHRNYGYHLVHERCYQVLSAENVRNI